MGAEKYVAVVPQAFDLWQDPQERYDIFMNNYTERTWILVTIIQAIKELIKTYVKYPPRKLQSEGIRIRDYQWSSTTGRHGRKRASAFRCRRELAFG